jgi:ABC-type bacteriocin/lantibiotic exporter with double-glycine peptidase domain
MSELGVLIAEEPEVTAARADPGELAGAIELVHVSHRYSADGPLVLDDVSLSVAPGEFLAVVGPSGSGKSTVLRLLLGFERPEAGVVLYDDRDVADLDVSAVRRQCGVVLQEAQLLAGNILSNIAGTGAFGLDDAWEAARQAGLVKDIEAMPMGMHTMLAEGASTISGGQRQRIMIARAIVSRPRIVMLDEATSALDNRTQDIVTESMRKLNATRVVIAHRLSTIRHADRIVVMDRGRVVQTGTYDELLAVPGLFRDLAQRQIA